jgi:hypothetical protein
MAAQATTVRALNITCGIAVLFITLAYVHLLHHHFEHATHEAHHDPIFLLSIGAAGAVGIFSFIGAILLLRRPPYS